jgi:hypothetical protein
MKLTFLPVCLSLLPVLAACEATRYPTPIELFDGQAIISVSEGPTSYLDDHLKMLNSPMNIGAILSIFTCYGPTTDETVEAVDALVRQAVPAEADELYQKEDFVSSDWPIPAGTFLPDYVTFLLIDTRGRMVTYGPMFSRDFDGNYYRSTTELGQQIYRIAAEYIDRAEEICSVVMPYFIDLSGSGQAAAPLIVPD